MKFKGVARITVDSFRWRLKPTSIHQVYWFIRAPDSIVAELGSIGNEMVYREGIPGSPSHCSKVHIQRRRDSSGWNGECWDFVIMIGLKLKPLGHTCLCQKTLSPCSTQPTFPFQMLGQQQLNSFYVHC